MLFECIAVKYKGIITDQKINLVYFNNFIFYHTRTCVLL